MLRATTCLVFTILLGGCGGGPDCDECDAISADIAQEVADRAGESLQQGGLASGQEPCGSFERPQDDVGHYAAACKALRECLGEQDACD
jgi:hypothetical protein